MDKLLKKAIEITIEHGCGSVSLLQRKLVLGYNRAEKLMDEMYKMGVVGELIYPKPRQVLIKDISEVSASVIFSNALCLECGTTKENPENAFCVNGHDNWLESNDEMERFQHASKRFGVSMTEITNSIKNGIDLVVISD